MDATHTDTLILDGIPTPLGATDRGTDTARPVTLNPTDLAQAFDRAHGTYDLLPDADEFDEFFEGRREPAALRPDPSDIDAMAARVIAACPGVSLSVNTTSRASYDPDGSRTPARTHYSILCRDGRGWSESCAGESLSLVAAAVIRAWTAWTADGE